MNLHWLATVIDYLCCKIFSHSRIIQVLLDSIQYIMRRHSLTWSYLSKPLIVLWRATCPLKKWEAAIGHTQVIKTVNWWAVILPQAFVIAFTSDFIPRLVYQYTYSPDGTLHGFVNHTLSYFNVSDFEPGTAPLHPMHLGYKVEICR